MAEARVGILLEVRNAARAALQAFRADLQQTVQKARELSTVQPAQAVRELATAAAPTSRALAAVASNTQRTASEVRGLAAAARAAQAAVRDETIEAARQATVIGALAQQKREALTQVALFEDRFRALQRQFRLGEIGTQEYAAGLRQVLNEARVLAPSIQLSAEATNNLSDTAARARAELGRASKELMMAAAHSRSFHGGLARTAFGVQTLALSMDRGRFSLQGLSSALLSLSLGSPVMMGIIAGVSAIGAVFALLRRNADDAIASIDTLVALGERRLRNFMVARERTREVLEETQRTGRFTDESRAAVERLVPRTERTGTVRGLAGVAIARLEQELAEMREALAQLELSAAQARAETRRRERESGRALREERDRLAAEYETSTIPERQAEQARQERRALEPRLPTPEPIRLDIEGIASAGLTDRLREMNLQLREPFEELNETLAKQLDLWRENELAVENFGQRAAKAAAEAAEAYERQAETVQRIGEEFGRALNASVSAIFDQGRSVKAALRETLKALSNEARARALMELAHAAAAAAWPGGQFKAGQHLRAAGLYGVAAAATAGISSAIGGGGVGGGGSGDQFRDSAGQVSGSARGDVRVVLPAGVQLHDYSDPRQVEAFRRFWEDLTGRNVIIVRS